MIIIDIYGGLGNQMFQYAFGKSLSLKKQTTLMLDISRFKNYGLRDYMLSRYMLSRYDIFTKVTNRYRIKNRYINFAARQLTKLGIYTSSKIYMEKKQFYFDKNVFNANSIYYEGYWQSYKYFKEIRQVLLSEFCLMESLDRTNLNMLKKIKDSNSISIHVRRGDYINNPKVQNANLPLAYYLKAIKFINDRVKEPIYFIFSDDIEWVKNSLEVSNNKVFVDINSEAVSYFDLELMKNCKHNIIANSTFSWWGAWLNENEEKIILYPNIWMKYAINLNELFPKKWNKIEL